MKKRINPVIKPVIEAFQTAYIQTKQFAINPNSAINGLLVMGDAGTGKSHYVKTALRDAGVQGNVEYLKGGTITAASFYVKLYLNRSSQRIMVLDDVDIINHPEKNKIVPMILGAVQEGQNRQVGWNTAKRNSLMEEYDVPMDFDFNGNIIVITNYTLDDINKKMKHCYQAFNSRFNHTSCIFNHEQKYMYTKYLIEECGMLGQNCLVHSYKVKDKKVNGYPEDNIQEAMDFIDDNYMNFSDITPRVAVKIVDTIHYHQDLTTKRIMLNSLVK